MLHEVHVGTGTGYYNAILAQFFVGRQGRVTVNRYDASLAARARASLRLCDVTVIGGRRHAGVVRCRDVIYVNAGCTQPGARWLDGLPMAPTDHAR